MKFAVVFFALFVAAASAAPEARRPLRNFQRQQVQQHQSQGQRQYHGQGQQKFHGQNQRQFQRRYQQQHQVQPEVLHHQEQPQPQQLHQQQQQVVPVNNLRSLNDPSQARILKYENDNIGVGPYNYAWVKNIVTSSFPFLKKIIKNIWKKKGYKNAIDICLKWTICLSRSYFSLLM